jgi:hypothetical protein
VAHNPGLPGVLRHSVKLQTFTEEKFALDSKHRIFSRTKLVDLSFIYMEPSMLAWRTEG